MSKDADNEAGKQDKSVDETGGEVEGDKSVNHDDDAAAAPAPQKQNGSSTVQSPTAADTASAAPVDAGDKNKEDSTESKDESSEQSQNKGSSAPLGGLTTEDAAEAAEAALNSAYNFGSFLFKKVSATASKTANIIQKTVEEKTIVGEFTREQNKFVNQKHSKRSEAAVPPWVGYNEEEQMKEQILALSQDKRNFLRNPPAGVQFHFEFSSIHPIAMATLQEDGNLQKMRFELVPKKITEENFWRNYFYRVSLIKQSSQLTSLAAKSGDERKGSGSASHSSDEGSSQKGDKTPPISIKDAPSVPSGSSSKRDEDQLEMEPPDSPPGSEFISDAFNTEMDEADFKKGMEQLGMDKKGVDAKEEDVPEWEKELQQELQDFEVVGDDQNEEWEREINQMLEDEVSTES